MPPRPAPKFDVPTYDFTGRRVRFVPPPPAEPVIAEPSPLLEAIRSYLDRSS
jgi:hypothetical protein